MEGIMSFERWKAIKGSFFLINVIKGLDKFFKKILRYNTLK